MKILRIIVNGLLLVVADLAGIGLGALAALGLTGSPDHVWLQIPVAVVVTISLFFVYLLALRLRWFTTLQPRSTNELGWAVLASILWGILLFVPLHYATQGYVTSIGNIVALALYQVLINTIAMFGSVAIAKPPKWEESQLQVRSRRIPTDAPYDQR